LAIVEKLEGVEKSEENSDKWFIVDGAHRFTAVTRFQQQKVKKWENFKFPCVVLGNMDVNDSMAYSFGNICFYFQQQTLSISILFQ
jgi:hypothetical protein